MRRMIFLLILIGSAIALAQVPASLPSTAPAVASPDTAPATSTSSPETLPAIALTMPTTSTASTAPSTRSTIATTSTAPATTSFAASAPSTQNGSASYYRPREFRSTPPLSDAASAGPNLTPKPYPVRQYGALLSRSIFIKGSQRVTDTYRAPGTAYTPYLPTAAAPPTTASSFSVESILVFNGATNANGELVAFIENTGLNQISRYRVGDAVGQGAAGRVTAITLDSLDYTVGSQVTHVLIGQNLLGADVQVLTTQPVGVPTKGSSEGAPTTGPSATPSGGANDVLERLRQRRLKELGG